MASVLNRATKQYIESANTPDYPVAQWIINPDMSAVTIGGVLEPSKYWIITGDAVTLMSPAEMDAVDATELTASRDATAARLDQMEDIARADAKLTIDELNLHSQRLQEMLDAVAAATNLSDLKSRYALISPIPSRTMAQYKNAIRNFLGT